MQKSFKMKLDFFSIFFSISLFQIKYNFSLICSELNNYCLFKFLKGWLEVKRKKKKVKSIRAKGVAERHSIALSTVWLYAKQKKITAKKISPRVTVFSIDEVDFVFGTQK